MTVDPHPVRPRLRTDAAAILRRVSLGASAGAIAGLVVGGIGGRLAMLLLRLTSPDFARGVISDHGFEIGVFSAGTLFLLAATAVLGAIGGVAYVGARLALPARTLLVVWPLLCGTAGGSQIIEPDGIDLAVLRPVALAVVLFLAICAGGGLLTAILVERWSGWWWSDRRRTALAIAPTIPLLAVVPIAILTIATTLAALVLASIPPVRTILATRVPAIIVSAIVTVVIVASSAALAVDLEHLAS